jgi:hypothetical protein
MSILKIKYNLSFFIIFLYFFGLYYEYESMMSTIISEKQYPESIIYIGKFSFVGNYININFNRNFFFKNFYYLIDDSYTQFFLIFVYDIFVSIFLYLFMRYILFSFVIFNFIYKLYIYFIEYQTDGDRNNKNILIINIQNIKYDEGNKFIKFMIYFFLSLLLSIYFLISIIQICKRFEIKKEKISN